MPYIPSIHMPYNAVQFTCRSVYIPSVYIPSFYMPNTPSIYRRIVNLRSAWQYHLWEGTGEVTVARMLHGHAGVVVDSGNFGLRTVFASSGEKMTVGFSLV
jgi:hypothetical protein